MDSPQAGSNARANNDLIERFYRAFAQLVAAARAAGNLAAFRSSASC